MDWYGINHGIYGRVAGCLGDGGFRGMHECADCNDIHPDLVSVTGRDGVSRCSVYFDSGIRVSLMWRDGRYVSYDLQRPGLPGIPFYRGMPCREADYADAVCDFLVQYLQHACMVHGPGPTRGFVRDCCMRYSADFVRASVDHEGVLFYNYSVENLGLLLYASGVMGSESFRESRGDFDADARAAGF